MEVYELEELLYRILDGFIEFQGEKIYDPDTKILSLGKKAYAEAMRSCSDLVDDDDIYILLSENLEWDQTKEERFKELPKLLENAKVKYYDEFINISLRNKNRNLLKMLLNEHEDLSLKRNRFFNYTREGIAHSAMWTTMIQHMYSGSRKIAAIQHYQNKLIVEERIREVAMSAEWSMYSLTDNPFGTDTITLSSYQRQLLSWSSVYKNVRSNPECPADIVFKDHMAFDGWLIQQSRKSSAERKKQKENKNIDPNANIVFFPAANKDEVNEIHELNDAEGKGKIKSMDRQLQKKGTLKEGQFDYYKGK